LVEGFKAVPEVGHPLYSVSSHDEAAFISSKIKNRRDIEHAMQIKDLSDKVHNLKKQVHGLSRIEKGKLYGGDKTILYDKLGLINESDLEKYKGKVHIKDEIDFKGISEEALDKMLEDTGFYIKHKARKKNPSKMWKKEFDIKEFKHLVSEYQKEQEKLEGMNESERAQYVSERARIKEYLRDDTPKYFPLIIKASTAGTLETLLRETEKAINGFDQRI
jgi:hypothetical protein